jgi:hypothetical protein
MHAICKALSVDFEKIAIITRKLHFWGFFAINSGLGLQFLWEIIYLWILLERYSSLFEIE